MWKRGFSSSSKGPVLPPRAVLPPIGWDYPGLDAAPMTIAGPPGFTEPDFAKALKTIPWALPEVCVDESSFLINYDAIDYIKASQLARERSILGDEPGANGILPSVLMPLDPLLVLLRSLMRLARYYELQGVCLPNITLNDLAITGAGTFRLKGSDLGHRELSDDNFEDMYRNICAIFGEVISMCGDMRKLPEDYSDLEKKLASLTLSDLRDRYQISYDPFFLPLANKCTALLRMIDVILQMPERSTEFIDFTQNLPYMDVIGGCPVWQDMALKNDYLYQWFRHRYYASGRKEFLRFIRAALSHKLDHGWSQKFTEFLVIAKYGPVLTTLARNFLKERSIRKLQLEDLFPHRLVEELPPALLSHFKL
jgi:hypothetical protein